MTKKTCYCHLTDGSVIRRKMMTTKKRMGRTDDLTGLLKPACSTRTCSCLTERMMPAKRRATTPSPVSPPKAEIVFAPKHPAQCVVWDFK